MGSAASSAAGSAESSSSSESAASSTSRSTCRSAAAAVIAHTPATNDDKKPLKTGLFLLTPGQISRTTQPIAARRSRKTTLVLVEILVEYVDSEESMICALLRRRLMSASSLSSIPSKSANARTTSDVAAGLLRASFPEGLRRVAQIHRPRRVSCAAPGTPLRAVSTVSGLPRGAGPAPSRCLYVPDGVRNVAKQIEDA